MDGETAAQKNQIHGERTKKKWNEIEANWSKDARYKLGFFFVYICVQSNGGNPFTICQRLPCRIRMVFFSLSLAHETVRWMRLQQ